MRGAVIVAALCIFAGWARGQPADSLHAILTVTTEPEGAEVIVDSTLVGRSPVGGIRLMPGPHTVELAYPSAAEWNALRVRDTVLMAPGELLAKQYSLGMFVRVITIPPGAVVIARDSALGITPYVFRSPLVQPMEISLRKEGHGDSTISLQPRDQLVRILLFPDAQSGARPVTREGLRAPGNQSEGAWATYAAAASTIGFGIATAYFNHEANRNFALYGVTDDPRYLDATKKYDRAALWTLVITELSFGLLAYFLLTE